MHPTRLTLLIMLLAVLAWNCQAQPVALADPTRPAAALAAASVGPAASRPSSGNVRAASGVAPRLQSIQLRAGGQATALLDGRVVRIGTRIGERTVVNIDAQGMTLRGARGNEQLLTLLSGVHKTPSAQTPDVVWPVAVGAKDMARKEP
jgi:MSHA biogenesis protein MshK